MTENSIPQAGNTAENDPLRMRIAWLKLFMTVFGFMAALYTKELWFTNTLFPQVPFFSELRNLPANLSKYLFNISFLCLFFSGYLFHRKYLTRWLLSLFAIFAIAVILLNQERFQPWLYHLILTALILSWANSRLAIQLLRILVISIYFYSAFSKMDVTFPELTGKRILFGLFQVIDIDPKFMDPARIRFLVFLFPAGELLTGLLLCFRRTRFLGLLLSIAMHAVLILTFSPLGLNHQNAVLLWNGYFILQNFLIFRAMPFEKKNAEPTPKPKPGFGGVLAMMLVGVVVVIPLLEPWGYLDHWPAWGLYSSRQERVRISIHESVAEKLDDDLKKFLEPRGIEDPWRRLRIHEWSLETIKAPIYPQDRFQTGVAIAVGEKYDLGDKIRLEREGVADRFSGKRTASEYTGLEAIKAYGETFRLNAFPSEF